MEHPCEHSIPGPVALLPLDRARVVDLDEPVHREPAKPHREALDQEAPVRRWRGAHTGIV